MALPQNGTPWPPEAHKPAYRQFQEFQAWYAGDPDQLAMIYSTTPATGWWGQIKRMFWGSPRPNQTEQRPNKLHVPVPAELARMSAQIMWGEMPAVEFPANDDEQNAVAVDKPNARLDDLLDDGAHSAFLEGAELGAALTGHYLRVCWDTSLDDKPFIVPMAPDQAIPTFRHGRLSSVVFWQQLAPKEGDKTVWTLLEEHTPGYIEYGLYASLDPGSIGVLVPLTEHPATASLAKTVSATAEATRVETGSELLTAVYVPNVKPNRAGRKDPILGAMGRSDYDGSTMDLFDALDETYTSWMRDIRLGKGRILVARQLLGSRGPGQGATFNTDQEVFVPLQADGLGALNGSGGNTNLIEKVQFDIRYQEHEATAKNLLARIFSAAGYSPATFGETSGQQSRGVTATEIAAREKLTMMSRGAKIMYARPQVARIIAALMDVDRHVFNGPGRPAGLMPLIEFPDGMAVSPMELANTLQLLRAAEAASTKTLVEMEHPEWDADTVDDEVARILAERSTAAPPLIDPLTLGGADLGAADPAADDQAGNDHSGDGDGVSGDRGRVPGGTGAGAAGRDDPGEAGPQ